MTPAHLKAYLNNLISKNLQISTMIWGSAGIGKSSIVKQIAQEYEIEFTDVRLSQLAPTDLRGLPVAENEISKWYPPEFLPRSGKGILFLDELNMAPPAMQGVAQQLILDRKVGSYVVPSDWFVWAAGNRKEDRAAVFDMPAPLANRFLHLEVQADFDSFKAYALEKGIHEQIIAFISFRPTLLHKIDPQQPAWPSPRSWEMASALHQAELDITPAVGVATASEFQAFTDLYKTLPNLKLILAGQGDRIPWPQEPSAKYATAIGLTLRAADANQAYNAFLWLSQVATAEWVQLFAVDLFRVMRSKGQLGVLAQLVQKDAKLQQFLQDFQQLVGL
ncbi:ATPase [Nostoc linckia z18]|uniref:ATPase n=3 Tax=Nostoc linckia TaxID=92942 RepID=A0A9Q6EHH0_NOSLI|nr:MoxR family ATPase [Nostoc linckia]PHK28529.1 ATPase [Nostoc linckia z15]PHK38964.1 ATPase [Nostoc linckia z16]PHJ53890.1 ATPase [Nostoc linckia z1]PHJ56305.1 ATPase [Nostoc linckia z3]PHJ56519.1 ATPase [Nostoc linckia z2]